MLLRLRRGDDVDDKLLPTFTLHDVREPAKPTESVNARQNTKPNSEVLQNFVVSLTPHGFAQYAFL